MLPEFTIEEKVKALGPKVLAAALERHKSLHAAPEELRKIYLERRAGKETRYLLSPLNWFAAHKALVALSQEYGINVEATLRKAAEAARLSRRLR